VLYCNKCLACTDDVRACHFVSNNVINIIIIIFVVCKAYVTYRVAQKSTAPAKLSAGCIRLY